MEIIIDIGSCKECPSCRTKYETMNGHYYVSCKKLGCIIDEEEYEHDLDYSIPDNCPRKL